MTPTFHHAPFELDLEATLAAATSQPGTLLLEGGAPWDGAAASALLYHPRWTLREDSTGRRHAEGSVPAALRDPARDLLRLPFESFPRQNSAPLTPTFCGLAGYYSYEYGSARHGTPRVARSRFEVDDVWLGAYDRALIFGGGLESPILAVATSELWDDELPDLNRRWNEAAAMLRELSSAEEPRTLGGAMGRLEFLDPDWHRGAVERIHEYLVQGDCYQVNLTGFASSDCDIDPFLAYQQESRDNPVAFSAFLRSDSAVVSCHSPELLLRLRGTTAETAPIKGTWPAGVTAANELRASPKDLAEHVMIVDLCRNDLGRNAEYGSVRVEDLARPLHLRGLVHLVSRIRAEISDPCRSALLADLFPAGSITGAPKRRTMEIIAEIEREARGPYTGSFGYVDIFGNADWNIAIRTAVWQTQRVHFGCGGGIVLDSEAEREYEEARLKAASFFASLETVARRATAGPALRAQESTP
jgi:para-aminobenzoate synthetase component I